MIKLMRLKIALLCAVLSFAGGNAAAQKSQTSRSEQARAALLAAFAAETKQDYISFYGFFSKAGKRYLLKQAQVRTAEDYRLLRIRGEAHWFKHELLTLKPRKDGKYAAVSRASIEEMGERDEACVGYVLVLEEGKWKIDDWAFLKACPEPAEQSKHKP
jgi:hypothetical protein